MRRTADRRALAVTALVAVAVWMAVDRLRWLTPDPIHLAKLQAAELMQRGTEALRAESERRGLPWDDAVDPNRTALVGHAYTDLTTTLGSLPAKRTSTNPNMAGVVVELLARSGVQRGDPIAVSFSGSFPALNLAVLSATAALELRPTIISSVGASSFGANDPRWTWIDMEQVLFAKGVTSHRSACAALGGVIDERGGLDGTGIDLARAAIERSGVPLLDEGGRATLEHDVRRRLAIFRDGCGGTPRAFVNVGGGLTSLGATGDDRIFPPGLNVRDDGERDPRRGLIARMLEQHVPVVHLLDVQRLATRHGLPVDPQPLPAVPSGAVMRPQRHGRLLAVLGIIVLGVSVVVLDRRSARTSSLPDEKVDMPGLSRR